ncbi:MAG: DUF4349 domain-containing protein [Defluviitaleaceae bacterium]|nr:DUF4349 domain-containing protein [Defluviitaleaceae bacterium]
MKNNHRFYKLATLVMLLGVLLIFTSCSSDNFEDTPPSESEPMADAAPAPEAMFSMEFAGDMEDSLDMEFDMTFDDDYFIEQSHQDTEAADIGGTSDLPADGDLPPTSDIAQTPRTGPAPMGVDLMQRMIIRTANMTLNTLYYEDTATNVESIVANRGGFIENSRQWLVFCQYAGMLWRAEYTIRVPAGLFDTTNNELMGLAQVQYFSTTSRDATHEFNDLGSRLQIRLAEEVRVQRMLEEATELIDIINLEARLTSLRLSIDAYSRRREEIDQLSTFSTINLHVYEVAVLPEIEEEDDEDEYLVAVAYTFGNRIGNAFRTSANFTTQALEVVGVFLALIILPAGLLALFLTIAYFTAKKVSGGKVLRWLKS